MATKLIIKSGNTQPNVDNLDINELGIYNKKLWSKTADEEVYAFGDDKVDKVEGKQLSTNDYTTEEKQKLAGLSNYTLPTASTTIVGGIKIGSDFSISSGVISLKDINFSKIINRPTTLAGYGITDALSDSDILQSITDDTGNNDLPVSQLAVKDYVISKVSEAVRGNDAMVIKGTLGTGGDFTSLPTYGYVVGWSYKIITSGTYAGYTCEVGDLIYATNDGPLSGSSVINSDWSVIQSNIVGAISASTSLTANQLVVGNSYAVSSLAAGSNGQVLKIINGKPGWSTDNNDNTTYTFTSGNDGTFKVTPSNGSPQTISIGTVALANALNLSDDIGSTSQPVYFDINGFPKPIAFTINSNVPANAKFTDTTYAVFGRSANGLVPHPTTTTSTRFLREDGTWVVPTNTTYSLATTSKNGLLRQLDGNSSHFLRGDGTWAAPPQGISSLTDLGVTATATELNYMDGVTSNVQTQLNAKQAAITGGASTIASTNLTANRALVSNGSGKVAVSNVTSTELGYLDGVTSKIQTQLNSKAASSHNHSAANITSGTLPLTRGGTGVTSLENLRNLLQIYPINGATNDSAYTWHYITIKMSVNYELIIAWAKLSVKVPIPTKIGNGYRSVIKEQITDGNNDDYTLSCCVLGGSVAWGSSLAEASIKNSTFSKNSFEIWVTSPNNFASSTVTMPIVVFGINTTNGWLD